MSPAHYSHKQQEQHNTAAGTPHSNQEAVCHIDGTPPLWSAQLDLESIDRYAWFLRSAYTVREKERTVPPPQADTPSEVGGGGSGHWAYVIAVGTVGWNGTWPTLSKQMDESLEDT